jgi:hypothetical protein
MRWRPLVASCAVAAGAAACSAGRAYDLDGGDLARAGAAFAQQRGCGACHEPSDHAGTLAGQLTPVAGTQAYGSNLTPDRTTGLGGWADIAIVRAIRFGVDDGDAPLCPAMPRYPDVGDAEAQALVAYLRSLPAVSRMVPPSQCPPIKPTPPPDMATPPD